MAGSWSAVSGNSEIKTDFCPGTGNALPCVPFSFKGQEPGEGSGATSEKTGNAGTQPDRSEQKQSAPSPVSPPPLLRRSRSLALASIETAFADGKNPRLEAGTGGGAVRPSCI